MKVLRSLAFVLSLSAINADALEQKVCAVKTRLNEAFGSYNLYLVNSNGEMLLGGENADSSTKYAILSANGRKLTELNHTKVRQFLEGEPNVTSTTIERVAFNKRKEVIVSYRKSFEVSDAYPEYGIAVIAKRNVDEYPYLDLIPTLDSHEIEDAVEEDIVVNNKGSIVQCVPSDPKTIVKIDKRRGSSLLPSSNTGLRSFCPTQILDDGTFIGEGMTLGEERVYGALSAGGTNFKEYPGLPILNSRGDMLMNSGGAAPANWVYVSGKKKIETRVDTLLTTEQIAAIESLGFEGINKKGWAYGIAILKERDNGELVWKAFIMAPPGTKKMGGLHLIDWDVEAGVELKRPRVEGLSDKGILVVQSGNRAVNSVKLTTKNCGG